VLFEIVVNVLEIGERALPILNSHAIPWRFQNAAIS
jgi:hypothetical protein